MLDKVLGHLSHNRGVHALVERYAPPLVLRQREVCIVPDVGSGCRGSGLGGFRALGAGHDHAVVVLEHALHEFAESLGERGARGRWCWRASRVTSAAARLESTRSWPDR